jgi:hypothetical protein
VTRRRLSIPATIIVAVVGVGTAVGVTGCDDDDDDPQECTIEGECPADGRVCLDEQTMSLPCCPICPIDGATCPTGCVLSLPPI